MAMTKTEQKKLASLERRARKIATDATSLAKDAGKELMKQMKKS